MSCKSRQLSPPPTLGGPHFPLQVQAPDQRGWGGGGRARPGRRLGRGESGEGPKAALRSPADGRGGLRLWHGRCDLHAPSLLVLPPLRPPGWELGFLRFLPAMSLGVSNLAGRGEGDHLGLPPLQFRENGRGEVWSGEVIWLHPWTREERESGIWGMGCRTK